MYFRCFSLVLFFLMLNCSTGGGKKKIVPISADNVVTKAGIFQVSGSGVRIKKRAYHVKIQLHNISNEMYQIVMLSDIACYRGNEIGEIKHGFFGHGERIMDFFPGQTKRYTLACKFSGSGRGDMKIVVKKVYDNPAQDKMTPEKMVAKNIIFVIKDPG